VTVRGVIDRYGGRSERSPSHAPLIGGCDNDLTNGAATAPSRSSDPALRVPSPPGTVKPGTWSRSGVVSSDCGASRLMSTHVQWRASPAWRGQRHCTPPISSWPSTSPHRSARRAASSMAMTDVRCESPACQAGMRRPDRSQEGCRAGWCRRRSKGRAAVLWLWPLIQAVPGCVACTSPSSASRDTTPARCVSVAKSGPRRAQLPDTFHAGPSKRSTPRAEIPASGSSRVPTAPIWWCGPSLH